MYCPLSYNVRSCRKKECYEKEKFGGQLNGLQQYDKRSVSTSEKGF